MFCHFRRHLKGAALSVYEFALGLAHGPDGEFFASNATTMDATGYARDAIVEAKKRLTKMGWFECLGGNRTEAMHGGRFRPDRFRIVRHDEWAQRHPGECSRVGKTPRRENPDTGKSGNAASGKSDFPASAKPRRNLRNNSSEGRSMEGKPAEQTGLTAQEMQPLAENSWSVLRLGGGTGNAHFDALWSRRYAAQRELMPIEEIIAGQICGCGFDDTPVPEPFVQAASRFEWESIAKQWTLSNTRFLQSLREG